MTIETRLRDFLHDKATTIDVPARLLPATEPRVQRSRTSMALIAVAAALILVGVPLVAFRLTSSQPGTSNVSSTPSASTATSSLSVVPSSGTDAIERFYAVDGSELWTDPGEVLLAYTTGPDPIELPADAVVQSLTPPDSADSTAITAVVAEWGYGWETLMDRLTPILVTGTNKLSGVRMFVWVGPAETALGDHEFCVAMVSGTDATIRCGRPGLVPQPTESPDSPSGYELPTSGIYSFDETDGFTSPISIGTGYLPLETAYAILTSPNGERWLQQPISGTVLFAVDSQDPTGDYTLGAYDAQGNELAVGWYTVQAPQTSVTGTGPIRTGSYTCEPPLRTYLPLISDALETLDVIKPGSWRDGLEEPRGSTVPPSQTLAEATGFECQWELTGTDASGETVALSIAWADDNYMAIMAAKTLSHDPLETTDEVNVPGIGATAGTWLNDNLFAGPLDKQDVLILLTSDTANLPSE